MNFPIKERLMLRISGGKRRTFSTLEVGRKKKLAQRFKKWESYMSVLKKKKKKKDNYSILSLAWYIVYWLLKGPCFEFFRDGKYGLFWAKKSMEIWYLLITGKFLFWTFPEWEIRPFFDIKSWWKGDIYWLLESSSFQLFGDEKYGLF